MKTLPGAWLRDLITVEPHLGPGPIFGPPITVRAHVQHTSGMPGTRATGIPTPDSVDTTYSLWIRPGPNIPIGSRVTTRGLRCTATRVDIHDPRGLPAPGHVEIRAERRDFLPTSTVTILRGTPVGDAFGDLADVDTTAATGLDAHITETSQASSQPVDQRGGIVETYLIRLRHSVDVREGDRLRDDRTLTAYRVLDVAHAHAVTGPELGSDDVVATCRRVAPTSTPTP